MIIKNLIIFLILFVCVTSWSQALYIELLGKGFVNSVNYEHGFGKDIQSFNVQIGVGFAPTSLITVPASVNYVFGRKSHHLEMGAGVTYINGFLWADDDSFGPDLEAHANLLYRFQKPGGKFFFKIGATPFISRRFEIGPWFGAGVGYKFKSKKKLTKII